MIWGYHHFRKPPSTSLGWFPEAAGLLEGFDAIIADARPGKLPEVGDGTETKSLILRGYFQETSQ